MARELEPLECDHEWETYDKDGCLLFQECVVCDKTREIEAERAGDGAY
jgi:hypothetical protein